MMKSVKYRVSVVEFTSKKEHVKGIPAFGSYSFEEGGIRVWKAHGIGEESSFLRGVLNLSAETKQMEGSDNSLTLGWALKTERKSKRFNKNQKDYLTEKFDKGLKTGRKEDPFNVSESMLHVKNSDGTRRFTYDEILSAQQVTSFFSRMCKQNKHLEDDLEARRETEICTIRQEILNA
ncbi:Hypothetical predicted protein [Mytilus galloprovincialis]|uniref:Uncharacterized protein n=1 Tax=Mytilus galloprovincialis TaxID=29158 RepID=A0A8B6BUG1_MYTGA|nr:Hypothetical predicted protein [Mytilus galloprovincialis]